MKTAALLSLSLCAMLGAEAAAEPAVVEDIGIEPGWILIQLSKPAGYRTMADGSTLTITLSDTEISSQVKDLASAGGMVRKVTASRVDEGGQANTRIAIEFDIPRDYAPSWNGKELTIELKGPPPVEAPEIPTPKPIPPKKAVRISTKRTYRVQLGSFPDEPQAVKFKAALAPAVGPAEIMRAEVAGKAVYRVVLGPFANRPAAKTALETAAAQGHNGVLTKD